MPSPPMPRSAPQPLLSRGSCGSRLRSSTTRSTISAPAKTHWSKPIRKLNISRNNNSDLTEGTLEEHNKRHQFLDHGKGSTTSSPYYKGLTDASLSINRQKLTVPPPPKPPLSSAESQATTNYTSFSFLSVLTKVQEWSSCFSFRSKSAKKNVTTAKETAVAALTPVAMSVSSVSSVPSPRPEEVPVQDITFELFMGRGEVTGLSAIDEEKPLRERVELAPPPITLSPRTPSPRTPSPRTPSPQTPSPQTSSPQTPLVSEKPRKVSDQKVFLWADRYRPKALEDFICNRGKALLLQTMVKSGECGHFIFEGQAGVGKRTMVWAFLRETFGPDNTKTWEECQQFTLKGESIRSINVNMKKSSQHVEVNLSDLKGYERHILVELIKEQHNKVVSNKKFQYGQDCRAIILYEADKLSTDVQFYISWLLERYKLGYNKVFFCCTDASKLQSIQSLCTIVQLLPPSNEEIVQVLKFIAKQENIELPHQLAEKIAENSKHNLRQAIRSFEASWQKNNTLKEDQVLMTGWEEDIATVAKNIVEEQSPKQLYTIRGKLQKLIEHNVSPIFIFMTLKDELKKLLDEKFVPKVESLYEDYNINDNQSALDCVCDNPVYASSRGDMGKRQDDPLNVHLFMRIEEFIAKFMSWYKISVINTKA